jgi:serine/threonine protein kinase
LIKVPVAIKVLKTTMDSRSKEEMKKEAFVMKELSHPCIVRLYGVSQSRKMNSTLMVFKNCSKYRSFFY